MDKINKSLKKDIDYFNQTFEGAVDAIVISQSKLKEFGKLLFNCYYSIDKIDDDWKHTSAQYILKVGILNGLSFTELFALYLRCYNNSKTSYLIVNELFETELAKSDHFTYNEHNRLIIKPETSEKCNKIIEIAIALKGIRRL